MALFDYLRGFQLDCDWLTEQVMTTTTMMTTTITKLPARRPRKGVNKSKRRQKFLYGNLGDAEEGERLHTSFVRCVNQMSERVSE